MMMSYESSVAVTKALKACHCAEISNTTNNQSTQECRTEL
jgi:hypothetical protein